MRVPCRVYPGLLLSLSFIACRSFLSSLGSAQHNQRRLSISMSTTTSEEVDGPSPRNGGGNLTVIENDVTAIETYSIQAQKLRAEIKAMEAGLEESKKQKLQKEQLLVEEWMDRLLVNQTYGEGESSTQILNSVEQVAQILKDKRYSPTQVDKIFRALTRGMPRERIEQSLVKTPLLALLVEACGELDMLEREENPNRRWNGRMERDLRRRLFAMEWGIDPDDLEKKDEN